MIELVDVNDSRAVRNKDNILGFYDLMINKKRSGEAAAKYVSPGYIQHNPLIPNGADGAGLSALDRPAARPGDRGAGSSIHRERGHAESRSGSSHRWFLCWSGESGPSAGRDQLSAGHAETRRALDV
jgi:hypothetical protein